MDEGSQQGDRDLGSGAGWHADPTGRYEFRWFNGTQWTADVSVDGQRYVDPLNVSPAPMSVVHQHAPDAPTPPLRRTVAVLSLVFGLISVTIAWVPFLFVVGALGAIAAIVLGIIGVRRARAGTGGGRGLAVAGIATGVGALCLCPIGVILSVAVYDEIIDYEEPGPNFVDVTSCTRDGTIVAITGTIENRDDEEHGYVVEIAIDDGQRRWSTAHVEIDDVAPGDVREWTHRQIVSRIDSDSVLCDVRDVTGPYPFGIDLDG
ncbi:MAG: DUF2510 domain-containing protein [Ilumatobacteraceae bacterium]